MSKRLIRTAWLCGAMIVAGSQGVAAQTPYTPPPLFGAAPVKIEPAKPASASPEAPANPSAQTGVDALKEAASVSERVETPVQTAAPINTELLLDHPADRVAEKAEALLKAKAVKPIPDFASYDDVVPPTPKVSKTKSRSIVTKSTTAKSKVLVLSRDPKTGKFERNNGAEMSAQSEVRTTNSSYAPPPPPKNTTAKKTMPAVPPKVVEKTSLGVIDTTKMDPVDARKVISVLEQEPAAAKSQEDKPPLEGIPPLSADMSDQLLASSDTSLKANTAPALPLVLGGQHGDGLLGNQHVLLLFKPTLTDLTPELKGAIGENVLPKLNKNPNLRVEIRAYASPSDDSQSGDRRVSLARGLSVREYLREQGVDANRMDVRALGRNTDRAPFDRVDIVLLQNGEPL